MRQRIDLEAIYERAVLQIDPLRYGGKSALAPPARCTVTLDELLTAPCAVLETAFLAHGSG